MQIDPDGKIVVAGWTSGSVQVARLKSNGMLDTTFGTSGVALLSAGSNPRVSDVRPDPAGGYVIAGAEGGRPFVLRVDATGHPRAGFGSSGVLFDSTNIGTSTGLVLGSGHAFVAAIRNSTELVVIDFDLGMATTTTASVKHFGSTQYVRKLLRRPDGRFVAVGGFAGVQTFVTLFDVSSGEIDTWEDFGLETVGATLDSLDRVVVVGYHMSLYEANGAIARFVIS